MFDMDALTPVRRPLTETEEAVIRAACRLAALDLTNHRTRALDAQARLREALDALRPRFDA
jgi:hypothetical protein